MPLQQVQITQFYQTLEAEKTLTLQKLNEPNVDQKEWRKLNKLFCVLSVLQSNLIRLKQLNQPVLE
jgi:hypothetical protein